MKTKTGIVYGIFHNNHCIYIGSTWNLEDRIQNHYNRYYYGNAYTLYKYINKLEGQWNAVQFKTLHTDTYPCVSLLRQDERMILDSIPYDTCNDNLPFRLQEEEIEHRHYLKSLNKVKYALADKVYYLKNKNRILAKKSEKVVCSCGKTVSRAYLTYHKLTSAHTN